MANRHAQHNDLELILDKKMKPTDLDLALLRSITGNFSEEGKIGEGGFGTVYKGVVRNGYVAVKKIMNSHTIDEKLFRREVTNLMKVDHENAVRFLGFCSNTAHKMMQIDGSGEYIFAESRQRLLCFEYVSNGSLDKHITDELRGLEWDTRYNIIKGICKGLYHLHKENGIIHMDLKPANILLDNQMVPKITDFGLSRLEENSQTMSPHRFLTVGYCAPEYQFDGKMSLKSDMYSLGVIIIELVTGHRGIPDNTNDIHRRWRHRWKKSAKETPLGYQQLSKCIEIGLLCQERDPYLRPYIWEIIDDISEMGSFKGNTSSVSESTFGQISPYSDDGMLGIEPLELRFPLEFNTKICCSIELTNETDAYIVFNIQTMSPRPYCTQPEKGIVSPRSKCSVHITLEPHDKPPRDMQDADKLMVRSTKVNEVLTSEDITKVFFVKERGNVVDEVNLDVVFDAQLQAPCLPEEPKEDLPLAMLPVLGTGNLNDPEASDVPHLSAHAGPAETQSEVVSSESLDTHVVEVVNEAKLMVVSDALPLLSSSLPDEPNEDLLLAIPVIDNQEAGHASDEPQSLAGNDQISAVAELVDEVQSLSVSAASSHQLHLVGPPLGPGETITEVVPGSKKLLDIHPLVLRFPFEPNKLATCSLHLTNNTDEHVVFRLMTENWRSFAVLPLYGIVPSRSIYTLVVTTKKQEKLPEETKFDLNLESSALGDEHIQTIGSQYSCGKFFEKLKEKGNGVQQMTLQAVSTPHGEIMSELNHPRIKILSVEKTYKTLYSVGINPTNQWIITGHLQGYVRIWNYQTQRLVDSFKVSTTAVYPAIFIARKQWLVVASACSIHVYNYGNKMVRITSFRASNVYVESLAVHPTKSYMLSSAGIEIKLWDWDKGWECTQKFENEHSDNVRQISFNPNDSNSFASASADHTVKVWSLDSPKSNYTLSGHSDKVNCLDFFARDDQQYLVTGSHDRTAKIWDLKKKVCIHMLEAFMSPVISVSSHPGLPVLLTGLENGDVYLWSSTNFRLERILNIGCNGHVWGLACLKGSRRVVIGQENAVSIMDIGTYNEKSTDYREPQLSEADTSESIAATDQKLVEVSCMPEVIPGSSELLDIHPLELRFPFEPEKSIPCSLLLTNNTDEYVAFRLLNNAWYSQYLRSLPLFGIVPPRFTYTLVVTTTEQENLPKQTDYDLVLQSSIPGDKYIHLFEDQSECNNFFEEYKEMANAVHEVTLKAVIGPQREISPATSEAIPPRMKIISVKEIHLTLYCIDAHPTEPWIVTGNIYGDVSIWNYDTQRQMDSCKVSDKSVNTVKFIARKQCVVAGSSDGLIHVCNSEKKMEKITSLTTNHSFITSLAIHPTQLYLLSSANNGGPINLWNWDKGWECTQTFVEHSSMVQQVSFNPKDSNSFASASDDHTVKVWSLDSPKSNYTLSGHSEVVKCLDFFSRDDQQYLITGSDDQTAKIWDMQKKTCVHTLEGFRSPVTCVISHPSLPVLLAGTKGGTVHLWSSTDFRLKRILNVGCKGKVIGLACLMGSTRVVIGQHNAVSIMDIDNE